MAEGWSVAAANAALTAFGVAYPYVQRHTGPPGAAGTSNVAADATRKQVTWTSPSGGAMANSGAIQWTNVSASEDYSYISHWSASSGGNFGGSGTITANAVTSGDTFTIPDGDLDVTLPTAS